MNSVLGWCACSAAGGVLVGGRGVPRARLHLALPDPHHHQDGRQQDRQVREAHGAPHVHVDAHVHVLRSRYSVRRLVSHSSLLITRQLIIT